jgi:hypothetical protein
MSRSTTLFIAALAALVVSTSSAAAQPPEGAPLLKTVPADAATIETYYKQNVYDSSDQKIGSIADLLVDRNGLMQAAMVSVGSFLALERKVVAVPFNALQLREKDREPYLVLDVTKRALKDAATFRYNRKTRAWERVVD